LAMVDLAALAVLLELRLPQAAAALARSECC
jgi:hypothetical protein